jgi:predicted ATPase
MALAEHALTKTGRGVFRTPDQRLRVFISSTIGELKDERVAAERAIRSLRFHPVLFEMGARPHPPRDLYRAYLAQSAIFIGIYWQSYGWVAPEMEISGIEDEYRLSGDKPKLIYIKEPAPERHESLTQMLADIADADVSYRKFRTADELEKLIMDDLAVLITERFVASSVETTPAPAVATRDALPVSVNEFFGRDSEIERLEKLLVEDDTASLVTLLGPGGIGKSRLALEVGSRIKDRFVDGAYMVRLEAVTDPALVIPTIVHAIGLLEQGQVSTLETLTEFLRERRCLLVIDNFEQVLPAAVEIAHVLEACRKLKILVTSRAPLNIRGEHEFAMPPLELPTEAHLQDAASVRMFLARAEGATGRSISSEDNNVVAEIVRKLDGLPLAIELAAARTRVLAPKALLKRLDSSLEILKSPTRDMPERQQTMRTAIEWSYNLLNERDQKVFARCGIFRGGWTLEAAEAVCNTGTDVDVLDAMQSLVDNSLVRQVALEGEPRLSIFESVREFAVERLEETGEWESIARCHAEHFLAMVADSHDALRSQQQNEVLMRLEADKDNTRSALRWGLDHGSYEEVAAAGWDLWLPWWVLDRLGEGRKWMEELLTHRDQLSDLALGRALAVCGTMMMFQNDLVPAMPMFLESVDSFRRAGDMRGVAQSQLPLALMEAAFGQAEQAVARSRDSLDIFEREGDPWGKSLTYNAFLWFANGLDLEEVPDETFEEAVEAARKVGTQQELGMALANLGRRRAFRGDLDEGERIQRDALEILVGLNYVGPSLPQLESIAEVALDRGDFGRAARIYAAADNFRKRVGAPLQSPFLERREAHKQELEDKMGAEAYEREWSTGLQLSFEQAVRVAVGVDD